MPSECEDIYCGLERLAVPLANATPVCSVPRARSNRSRVVLGLVIDTVALQVALAAAGAQRDVLEAALHAGRGDHRLAGAVAQHEVDQVGVLARAVRVVADGAWGVLRHDMSVVGEGCGPVVDQKIAVVALVAKIEALR